ncbi:vacuolar protein sorting-associated protein 45 [Lodderomyces elongisporus]|uniref:vacuolar protein sorting-associated protein 45 n=1 Tax=Lodderomyces elongisporus TaxID=36914 RepID=UPI00291F76C5|nr:vacuolar protein sorting-associated protein 45 [Lodderomyces elongisporus]WLF81810.1 vacuolar protein sorting-associated protein 45 [Lodderomyces elongisporus]
MTLSLTKVKDVYFNQLFSKKIQTLSNIREQNDSSASSLQQQYQQKRPRVLLLDNYTAAIVSVCYTQTQLLSNDIILIEVIENQNELRSMKHLDCTVYIKPCRESLQLLCKELSAPHYQRYNIFFNNTVSKIQIEQLAEADEYESVESVIELFQDYMILNDSFFSIKAEQKSVNPVQLEAESIASLLLALKKTPIIKYESNSMELKRLGSELLYNINSNSNNNLFDDLNRNADAPPLLLLFDRKNDPITPLITPWTYQSMIHEFLKIEKNVVSLPEKQVIITEDDQFYKDSMYLNYGDLNDKFKNYVDKYKSETKQSSIENLKTQSLSELKKVLTQFPELKKFSLNILTHLNLIGELDEHIKRQSLWEVGELEQTIVCGLDSQQNVKQRLLEILEGKSTTTENKLKLVLLYIYKFHNPTDLSLLISKLQDANLTSPLPTQSQIELVRKFTTTFSTDTNGETNNHQQSQQQGLANLFGNKKVQFENLFNRNTSSQNDNIYLQYTPRLHDILSAVIGNDHSERHKILSTLIPDKVKQQYGGGVGPGPGSGAGGAPNSLPRDIIVYFKGGVTYEEARLVHELSASNKRLSIIIGGDQVLNSSQWLDKMCSMVSRENAQTDLNDETESHVQNRSELLRDIL